MSADCIGLCHRRHWPKPDFSPFPTRSGGWQCTVRVNSREYSTDCDYETEELARNAAATRAYMICRSFSVNDGMMPGLKPGRGELGRQGLPVAIGANRQSQTSSSSRTKGRERLSARSDISYEMFGSHDDVGEDQTWSSASGGDSPRSLDSGKSVMRNEDSLLLCYCRRAAVRGYGRCEFCLREASTLR